MYETDIKAYKLSKLCAMIGGRTGRTILDSAMNRIEVIEEADIDGLFRIMALHRRKRYIKEGGNERTEKDA